MSSRNGFERAESNSWRPGTSLVRRCDGVGCMGVPMADKPDNAPPPPVVVIGASAGGVDALTALVSTLPPDLPAAILIVLHVAPSAPSLLPRILNRSTELTVTAAADGVALQAGYVHVAPPDLHLV